MPYLDISCINSSSVMLETNQTQIYLHFCRLQLESILILPFSPRAPPPLFGINWFRNFSLRRFLFRPSTNIQYICSRTGRTIIIRKAIIVQVCTNEIFSDFGEPSLLLQVPLIGVSSGCCLKQLVSLPGSFWVSLSLVSLHNVCIRNCSSKSSFPSKLLPLTLPTQPRGRAQVS